MTPAEEWLLGLELFGMRFGLDRMHKLMTALGLPQRRFAHVHVVGTNGKSSTTRFVAAILERHGVACGSYTSPHLGAFRERVEIGDRVLGEGAFEAAAERVREAAVAVERKLDAGEDRVTQFEALTAVAFHALAEAGVDAAAVEAGLGGRYDATNVIPSRVVVLTSVGLDHTAWLGDSVAAIAAEKLAVLRDHTKLVVGAELDPDAMAVAEAAAAARHAELIVAPAFDARADTDAARLRAAGGFQRENFALACAAAEAFLDRPLDRDAVRRAAAETRVPGRMDSVDAAPLTIHDGAHNAAGAAALAAALPAGIGRRSPVVGVLSVLADKDAAAMLDALAGTFDSIVFTQAANPRALPAAGLAALADAGGMPAGEVEPDPRRAVARARKLAGPDGAVVVTGSIYLIADLVRDPAATGASAL